MIKKILLSLALITINSILNLVYSQEFHTTSGKALKFYNDGVHATEYFDFNKAEFSFREAISVDKKFFEAYMMLGEVMTKQKRYAEAASYYRFAVRIDSLFYKPVFFVLANAEMLSEEFSNALIHYNVYIRQTGVSEKNKTEAIKNIKNCEFAVTAKKNPVPFLPVSVGSGINTTDDEYWPSITADGNTMMFTRESAFQDRGTPYPRRQEDFYVSVFSENKWQLAINAGSPLNTTQNEGAQSLSSNGNYMFFTACGKSGGLGSCDLYFSAYNDGKWSEPSNLKWPVNTTAWETQPSISADGKTLYFSSNRPGGFGGKDLWSAKLNDKNEWEYPVNLGSVINSEGDEMSPFIHFDGKTLYYSSNGKVGLGGFDIFVTRLINDTTWSEPVNLGYPINSPNDETGLVVESKGRKAYFSSIRDKVNGKDIFSFDLYESARPNTVSYLKGTVYDKETGKMLTADYELINLSTNKIVNKNITDKNGNFLVCLPSGYNYGINVNKAGYLFYSENFMLEGEHTVAEPFIKRISLNALKIGEKMQLSNVFYEVDSWELKEESTHELDNLVSLLNDNKDLIIEIGGHTDSTGSVEYNQTLSEKRAISVVNYLVKKGIPSTRLKSKGYGNTVPVGENETVEGRKLNRRTEAKIIDRKQN